jgi:hypothetical protein
MPRRALVAIGLLVLVILAVPGASARRLPKAPHCPVLPASNAFNRPVDELPVASNSDTLIRSIGLDATAHPGFGSREWAGGPIGIPYMVVGSDQKRVPVSFAYSEGSDHEAYPIPANVPIEGGPDATGDRHVVVIDRDRCRLYELYDAHPVDGGARWRAGSGAIFDLRSNRLRRAGWTSADAAGLPILPGLARYHEVQRGAIRHALRFTAPRTREAYVYPARHEASSDSNPDLPPMGLRVRLKRGADLSGLGPQAQIVARALQRYGALLADNGAPWHFGGAPDRRWNDDDLHTLELLKGSDFEVVDTSSLGRPR